MTKEAPAADGPRKGLDGSANLSTAGLNLSILCHCSCTGAGAETQVVNNHDVCMGFTPGDALSEHLGEINTEPQVVAVPASAPAPSRPPGERGIITYCAEINMPLAGPALREGEVWHLLPDEGQNFEKVTLALHVNGFAIKPMDPGRRTSLIAWSPFSLVQACRLHNTKADAALPFLRLFKVSVFHHGTTHFFAAEGEGADADRARWVADIARALRTLTQSLFPFFSLCMSPVLGAEWTATRLLAGYMVLCNNQDVSLVYCELHAHKDCAAAFVAYKDDYCDARIMHVSIGVHTCVSERVGVDCSCFSVDGHHFSTRSCMEKTLWLRAISNVKVKLRHRAENPSSTELAHYRAAIFESSKDIRCPSDDCLTRYPLLPRRAVRRGLPPPALQADERGSAENAGNDHAEGNHKVPCVAIGPPISGGALSQTTNHTPQQAAVCSDETVDGENDSKVVSLGTAPSQAVPEVSVNRSPSTPGARLNGPTSKPPQLPLQDGHVGEANAVAQEEANDGFEEASAEPVELPQPPRTIALAMHSNDRPPRTTETSQDEPPVFIEEESV